jgi:hypothetical protein
MGLLRGSDTLNQKEEPMTTATTKGEIIEAANGYGARGIYERDGARFVFTRYQNLAFCFCPGRASADIDAAWELGYAEEIRAGRYRP